MLGAVAEAEDVVQDAYLRWQTAENVANPGAYLSTVVTRLCLDVLKSARVKREQYVGQWLPEVVIDPMAHESMGTLANELSYGFMAMLERLTPEQRAVYVLRVAFDMEYAGIASALGTSAASCRQLMKKARARMVGPARFCADAEQSHALAARFAQACNAEDEHEIAALLGRECRFLSDGAGLVNAARRPVLGPSKITRLLLGLRRKYSLTLTALGQRSGSSPLLRVASGGLVGVAALDIDDDGAIVGVFFQWNPDKVSRLRSQTT